MFSIVPNGVPSVGAGFFQDFTRDIDRHQLAGISTS
jgi:hypothetical protein